MIDLDILDKVGSGKGVEELRVQLKQQVCITACNHRAFHQSQTVNKVAASESASESALLAMKMLQAERAQA